MLIRDLREDELPFLHDMLDAALAWRPDRWLPPKALLLRIPAGLDVPQGLAVERHRGSGIGTALMEAIHTRASRA